MGPHTMDYSKQEPAPAYGAPAPPPPPSHAPPAYNYAAPPPPPPAQPQPARKSSGGLSAWMPNFGPGLNLFAKGVTSDARNDSRPKAGSAVAVPAYAHQQMAQTQQIPQGTAVVMAQPPPPPAAGQVWNEARDPSSGQTYWYNQQTGESTWNNPYSSAM